MCILLYVKLIQCSGITQIYCQLDGGVHLHWVYVHSAICATYSVQGYYIDLWSIRGRGALVYVHSSICETYLMQLYSIDLLSIGGGVHLHWVYVNSAICETYLVQWYSMCLWSIGGGGLVYVHSAISQGYMLQQHSIYQRLIGGGCTSALAICAFCYMLNLFSVVVLHRSMVNWRRGSQ